MKKKACKIMSVIGSVLVLFCSCRENTVPAETTFINNGSFEGVMLNTSVTPETALSIPEISITSSEAVADETGVSSSEGDIIESFSEVSAADTDEAETTSLITTTEAEETTAVPATTTEITTATTETMTTTVATTTITTAASAETTTTSLTTTTQTTAAEAAPTEEITTEAYVTAPSDEVVGVWISYLEIGTLLKNKSEDDFRSGVRKIYDNCLSLGINTVYVHARAFGDAFYDSDLFPFTKYISGSIGVKISYDPYKILVEEAHKKGLSFHAWINPLRLCTAEDMKQIKSGFTIRDWYDNPDLKGKYIVNVNGTWYLNPAYDEAIQLVCDGVAEILENYDVDGIHIDDYFYPTTDATFDSSAYANSSYSSLSAFRINNCNKLVKGIFDTVHKKSDKAVFGASTQGSFQNNLNQMYADTEAWCKGGYVDYFAPQIYYGFNNSAQPFETCTDTWADMVSGTDVKLYIGLAVYKIGVEDKWAGNGKYEWCNTETMLKRQTEYARKKGCDGIVLYSYNYIFTNGFVTSSINAEITNLKPLIK